jgi:hypothetical protein
MPMERWVVGSWPDDEFEEYGLLLRFLATTESAEAVLG